MKYSSDPPSDDSISADRYIRRYHIVATLVCVVGMGLAVFSMMRVDSSNYNQESQTNSSVASSGRIPAVDAFDLSDSTLPRDRIVIGNPFKDSIPSLTEPKYVSAGEAKFLEDQDEIIGYVEEGKSRAYPLRIMAWHEAVNDQIAGIPYAITYCPLCKSVIAFDRSTEFGRIQLGVSGFLYNSNVLFYDKTDNESPGLFSQLQGEGITRRLKNVALNTLPVELTTWKDWKTRYPKTDVLSLETGHDRDYHSSAYEEYYANDKLMFPVSKSDKQFLNKSMVLGITVNGKTRAYPYQKFANVWKPTTLQETFEGKKFTLLWNPEAQSLRVEAADEGVDWAYSFWFAWYAFHPETEIYSADSPATD